MKMTYDRTVDALTIRFLEERVECEVLRLNDQVAVDIGPGERIVAIEILDGNEASPQTAPNQSGGGSCMREALAQSAVLTPAARRRV